MLKSAEVCLFTKDRISICQKQAKLAQTGKDYLYHHAMDIDRWIVAARESRGMTQGQLAEALGVTRGNVSGWENRRHEPSLSQIRKISAVCGVDAGILLADTDQGITKFPARDHWPFSFPLSLYESISATRKRELELIMRGFIAESGGAGDQSAERTG